MGRRQLALLARRSSVLLPSGQHVGQRCGLSTQAGRDAWSTSAILGARTGIRADSSTPAQRDTLRALVMPAKQEVEEQPVRIYPDLSSQHSASKTQVATDHYGAISMVCDEGQQVKHVELAARIACLLTAAVLHQTTGQAHAASWPLLLWLPDADGKLCCQSGFI